MRGTGINETSGERDAYRQDPDYPESQAADARSIQFLQSGARDDNPMQAAGDTRICRTSWPEDPLKRREAVDKVLPQAIREYFGNESVIEHRLSLEEGELSAISLEQPKIASALGKAKELLCALAEDCLAVAVVQDRSSTDARYLLERLYPEKYGRKGVSDKGNGRFLDLPSAEGPKSVLDGTTAKPRSEVQ
jgi:hypothetical protein